MSEKIKQYWEGRALEHKGSTAATTSDVWLRELEIRTLAKTITELGLPNGSRALDIGCGDGYSTLKIAELVPHVKFVGIDYSANMIEQAQESGRQSREAGSRVEFLVGDATKLAESAVEHAYDLVLTDRCLINLDSAEMQCRVINQIAYANRLGGYYLAVENFIETHENMNVARRAMQLPEIPVRWHNLYFREPDFVAAVEPFYEQITFKDFASSYYFATRVIYSAMCRINGEEPDYHHEINQLAINLPWVGKFSPTRMVVSQRKGP